MLHDRCLALPVPTDTRTPRVVIKKKKWRYYCEFCKKSGASGGWIAKHERGCTRNPDRICGMCDKAGCEQHTIQELLAVLEEGGAVKTLAFAAGCPACVVAAIHAHRKTEPLRYEHDTGDSNFIDFDYASAAKAFWDDLNRRDEY